MRNSHLALMVVAYLALSNRAMKGESIPSFEGNIQFSGEEVVTGSLGSVVAFLLTSAIFVTIFETIREWQSRSTSFIDNDKDNAERSEELGAAFSPLFTNPIFHLLIFIFNFWVPVVFGSFVVYKLRCEIYIFISRVLS